jgi:hypothetical protein
MVKNAKSPGWMKLANRVVVALQKRGLVTGTVRLLSVPGRKIGEMRTTPVPPLVLEGRRYIVGLVELPEDERAFVLREISREAPDGAGFFVRAGTVESPTPDSFAKAAPKRAVFEVVPTEGGRS